MTATTVPTTEAPVARSDELAQAAFRLFSSRGIAGVNMDAIAAEAGVTKGSLYWHYSSKKEVVLAACAVYYQRWRKNMGAALEGAQSRFAAVEAAIAFSVRDCLLDDANRVFTLEIIASSLYDEEIRASWAGFQDEVERHFLGLVHRAVGAGELEVDDVDGAVEVMVSAMEGVKQLALFRPFTAAPDSEVRIRRQLASLLGRPTTPGR
ncbi:TetR/AcrR family transcriptional regulator [Georgenia sunbinii]|uniref:TetR/AcrR family transcriptional regulator n=1 Tax=Georgenia sunbinii TaxID=3117728 RepID=UPI002F2616A4